ncbi:PTS system, fructose-specific IIC component/PTS system, nitrogen regulatory IIA component [Mariprofundus ferrinatatus]|uniref:PTS system, fructose-specific IIC component/PTS system, nitrogen regulatory IIA component n=1 Tax=Mariprofundus ferrinatatus TaxID=1921087 RepID=A0A2K8L1P3_9PROT|nr:PTS sugar transporter subunit IIA [Mariprofundus ferrinatatus]ATX81002.1 PTS system, fructose-specific IIC component/PTS system, nitrogen regulatory IIA component [Mariprofundus ferrinatatus]
MELLTAEHVMLDSEARGKRALITELAHMLTSIDPDRVMEVVMAREQLGSTGIGHGVAIPHGRMPDLNLPILALARHPEGVDFDSIDSEPVHIAVLLLVPDSDDRQHLELLAQLARTLQQKSIRDEVMAADSSEKIAAIFSSRVRLS